MSVDAPVSPVRLPWWRWINLLALDAVAVALVWLAVFGKMEGARLELVEFAALGVAVWMVYGADRLLDSRLPPDARARRERHWFVARHVKWLVPLAMVLAGTVAWWCLWEMRMVVVTGGIQLGIGVGVYFGLLAASRWKLTSLPVLLVLTPVMIAVLMRKSPDQTWLLEWWRPAGALVLVGVLFAGMNQKNPSPPWTLFRKLMGGFLFARGCALAPMMHLESGPESLWSAPVLLFGAVCTLNMLGIRIWEQGNSPDTEGRMLCRLYPWMGMAVAGGALTEAWAADPWSQPVLVAVGGCALALTVLHTARARFSAPVMLVLADTAVLVAGGAGLTALLVQG